MRHAKKKTTLGREATQRHALLRSLAESLILHGSIVTTLAKAKALRGVIEPLVTKAKKNSLAARRELMKFLYTDTAINKLFSEFGKKYESRHGGYTRIIKLGRRANDKGEKAMIEFI